MANKKSQQYKISHARSLRVESLEVRQMLATDCLANAEPLSLFDVAAVTPPSTGDDFVSSLAAQTSAGSVEVVSLPSDLTENVKVVVNVNGVEQTLDLTRYSIRGENFRLLVQQEDGSLVEIDAGEDKTYRGTVVDQPGTLVKALFVEGGIVVGAYDEISEELIWGLEPNSDSTGHVLLSPEALRQAAADPMLHDHDGDGVPDHTAEEHDLLMGGGGHGPGCPCEACCAQAAAANEVESVEAPLIQALHPELATPDVAPSQGAAGDEDVVAASQADAVLLNPITIREAEIAFDVTFEAFSDVYGSNVQAVMDNINRVLSFTEEARIGLIWVRDALIEHVLGNVVIRSTAAEDPYLAQGLANRIGTDGETLDAFRDEWNSNPGLYGTSHDLAHMITRGGGGLAWVGTAGNNNSFRYSQGGGTSSFWRGIARHEVGHTWGLNHSHGGIQFRAPDSNGEPNGNNYGIMWADAVRMAPTEHATVTARRETAASTLDDTGQPFTAFAIRPYAKQDFFTVTGSGTFMLDVLDNDHDANNDALFISGVGGRFSTSFTMASGSTLAIGNGLGDRGQDVLLYTPASGLISETIFYFNNDGNQDNFGQVDVTINNPEILVDINDTSFNYDPGPANNPILFPGATLLSPATIGDVFWSETVTANDRGDFGGQNQYNRDFVEGTLPTTLNHKLGPGKWKITVNVGDPEQPIDNVQVAAEGQVFLTGLSNPLAGSGPTMNFDVFVTDGELNLEFSDADTVNPRWAVERILIDRVQALGDFNNDGFVLDDDLVKWQSDYGQNSNSDADGDGDSDGGDFLAWQRNRQEIATVALVDENTGNGGLLTTTTASSDGQASTNLEGGLTTNDSGRALVNSGSSTIYVDIPGWRAQRVSYTGGNPAFGFDGRGDLLVGTEPAQYAFVNSGVMSLTSDSIAGPWVPGSVFDLSYWAEVTSNTGEATATLTFDNGETMTFGTQALGTTAVEVSDSYTLTSGADSVVISIELGTDTGGQAKLDSISLDVTTVVSPLAATTTATPPAISELQTTQVDATINEVAVETVVVDTILLPTSDIARRPERVIGRNGYRTVFDNDGDTSSLTAPPILPADSSYTELAKSLVSDAADSTEEELTDLVIDDWNEFGDWLDA